FSLIYPRAPSLCRLLSFPTRRSSDLIRCCRCLITRARQPLNRATSTARCTRLDHHVPSHRLPHHLPQICCHPAQIRFHQYLRWRSEEHTSELQSRFDLVCRLLLEKKN